MFLKDCLYTSLDRWTNTINALPAMILHTKFAILTWKIIYIPNKVQLAIIGNMAASLPVMVSGFSPDSYKKYVFYTVVFLLLS